MKIVTLFALLLAFTTARAENITTIGGTTTTGSSFLCLANPFSHISNVNNQSLLDYAQFNLLAGVGCSYYLQSTLNSIGAGGTNAGFRIQALNLTSLLTGITLDTYLDGKWQEGASGSNLLSLLNGGEGNVYFKTTKAYDAIRISFKGLLSVAYSVRIFWGFGENKSVETLPVSIHSFSVKEVAGKAQLTWRLEDDDNVESISIQKSLNNNRFATIGTLQISKKAYYTYADQLEPKAWYRLQINHKNGKQLYSPVVYHQANQSAAIAVYPNPVTGSFLNLHFKSDISQLVSYVIVDARGAEVQKGILVSGRLLNIARLYKGWYCLILNTGEASTFVKQ